jgi:putative drug exporter of the RND superfamily
MTHRFFDRLASGIVRYRLWFVVIWSVLILASFPFAGKLVAALAGMEGNRWVQGSESLKTDQLLQAAFPGPSSERRTATVITADDALSDAMKQLYLRLEKDLSPGIDSGKVDSVVTPLYVYRSVTEEKTKNAHKEYYANLAGARAQAPPGVAEAALKEMVIQAAVRQYGMGEGQTWLFREMAALGENPAEGAFTALADRAIDRFPLSAFPVAIDEEIKNRLVSPDQTSAVIFTTFPEEGLFQPQLTYIRQVIERAVEADPNLKATYATTSEKAIGRDMTILLEKDNGKMEIAAIGLVTVVLLIFFRSPIATGLTLGMILLATFVSKALLYFLLRGGVELNGTTSPVMTFVMLGAGVDYSMVLSERYQQERAAGKSKAESLHIALARSGESVFLSGMTVLIAFGATTFSQLGFIRGLGFGGIAAIITVLAAALTLTPALLSFLGDAFFWPRRTVVDGRTWFTRYLHASVRFTVRNPVLITILFALVIIPGALVMRSYHPYGHPLALTPPTEAKVGYERYAEKWGPSYLMPTSVAVAVPASDLAGQELTPGGMAALKDLVKRLEGVQGVDRVATLTQPFGIAYDDAQLASMPESVRTQFLNAEQRVIRLSIMLTDNPVSEAANHAVKRIQQAVRGAAWPGATITVGGSTAVDIDYRSALMTDFWQMAIMISVGIFLLLMLQLRSLITPLRLIFTILLGNVMAIGLLVVLFQWIRGVAITVDVPVMLVVLMMGLGLDYEIFLVTRVRELVEQGMSDREAVQTAVLKTGRVINFAGLLMAGTLGSMALASTLHLQAYGVALGAAVLLDATVLRTYLVPATMLLLKKYNWWLPFVGHHVKREEPPRAAVSD